MRLVDLNIRACYRTYFTFLTRPQSVTSQFTVLRTHVSVESLLYYGFTVSRLECLSQVSQRRQNALATGFTSSGAGGSSATGSGKAMGLNDVGLGWPSSKVPKVPRCIDMIHEESQNENIFSQLRAHPSLS